MVGVGIEVQLLICTIVMDFWLNSLDCAALIKISRLCYKQLWTFITCL